MATRNTSFAASEIFHIFNRGNSKQTIFLQPSDYGRFMQLLYLANTSKQFNFRDVLKQHDNVFNVEKPDTLVRIGAFCLMPNHFHIIASPLTEGALSKFMLKLGTSYAMYFNTKYERSGSLYEGSFKAKHVDSDEYLKYLFSYIHLNPVTKKTKDGITTYQHDAYNKARNYPYSSLPFYTNLDDPRVTLGLVDVDLYREAVEGFESNAAIKREIFDWLQFNNEELALG